MTTEQELKNQCAPEFTKWMVELAEGFEYSYKSSDKRSLMIKRKPNYHEFYDWLWIWHSFPLLIHRAVEGWNNKNVCRPIQILCNCISFITNKSDPVSIEYGYDNDQYQPQSLTQAECAMLNCMLDIFKEV